MKMVKRVVLILSLLAVFWGSPQQTRAQLAALPIGSVIQNIGELAKQLEDGAQALIQQGNTALAQQQMLAAGILRQLVLQLSETYKGSLDATFSSLAGAEANVVNDVESVLDDVANLEGKTATDAQEIIYKMQGGVNQIINKIPFISHDPVFYGMIVHDAFSEIPKEGIDLELLGLNFTDDRLDNKHPEVFIAGESIPNSNLSVQEDRIHVKIPDDVKSRIGFGDDACTKQSTFSASLKVFFKTRRSFMFIPINRETSVTFNAFALTGPERFVMRGELNGILKKKTDEPATFSVRSGQVTYGCEENNSGSANYTLPDGAKEVNCTAGWVDISNTKTRSASCAVGGSTVTATGTVRGRDRECIVSDILSGGIFRAVVGRRTACNCPGGGHATLQLSGSYKLPRTEEIPYEGEGLNEQRFLNEVNVVLPSDDTKRVTGIYLLISRDQCTNVLDRINLDLPTDPSRVAEQSSVNGLFKATFRAETLHLQQVDQ
ncbi:hypothetical protein GOD62_32565 [Sinorhizobium medicae]|nr:hypothetical protein [Sinorhizobium medicae]MDX0797236.1 hypothetical protein [Sinorhizobium medicae]